MPVSVGFSHLLDGSICQTYWKWFRKTYWEFCKIKTFYSSDDFVSSDFNLSVLVKFYDLSIRYTFFFYDPCEVIFYETRKVLHFHIFKTFSQALQYLYRCDHNCSNIDSNENVLLCLPPFLDELNVVLASTTDQIERLNEHAHRFAFDVVFVHLRRKLELIPKLEVNVLSIQ